jgi:hypothetical protein
MLAPAFNKDYKMSEPQRQPRNRESKNRIARVVKQRLTALISALSAILLIFIFRIGESLWLAWMVEYRLRIVALLVLVLICLLVSAPLILEHSKNPRPLSGPGKNPYIDP